MAMEDPRILLHVNMSFNPFRSSNPAASPSRPLPHQQQRRIDDPDNDSWHTNAPNSPNASFRHDDSKNSNAPSSQDPSSSALSWFSSWTTSSTKTATTSRTTSKVSAVIIHDGNTPNHPPGIPKSPGPSSHRSLSSQLSPAKSMTMNRGAISPAETNQTNNFQDHKFISQFAVPPLHSEPGLAATGGGCIPVQQNGSSHRISSPLQQSSSRVEKSMDENNIIKFDLPPYPEPKAIAPPTQTINASPRNNGSLLQEFPTVAPKLRTQPKTTTAASIESKNAPDSNTVKSSFQRIPIVANEETTFPGFALFQMAKAHYCLGRYSQALDTTTECLALQKLALSGSSEGGSSASAAALISKGNNASAKADAIPAASSTVNADASAGMTALDLRSTFATSVHSSVRGVVRSLKDSASSPKKGQAPHPMLSNSIAIMASRYPAHACVAQTLLLRGHVLAACRFDDTSLHVQAVQHVEMSIAIQRKLLVSDEDELARRLIFLAKLKRQLGQFDEADAAFKEAVFILRAIRSDARDNRLEMVKAEDAEVASDCAKYLKRITGEIAHALYLHGKSYHCQRMHAQAFDCYNKALNMLMKSGAGKDSLGVKNIVKCMKNRYSLEKLVSAYWDDAGAI